MWKCQACWNQQRSCLQARVLVHLFNSSGADWRHVNSPFSLRRTPRLVTESVMERAKVNESSRWWWWLEVATLDEEKSSSLIFFTKNERGMFQWIKTQSWEKRMRKKNKKDPLRKHKSGAGLTVVILSVNVKTTAKKHKIRKKMETSGEQGWRRCCVILSGSPSFPQKNKKIKNKSDPVQHWIAPVMQQA